MLQVRKLERGHNLLNECIDTNGKRRANGETWTIDKCTTCSCEVSINRSYTLPNSACTL